MAKKKPYTVAEEVVDDLAICTTFFIDTPDGRMAIRIPNFVSYAEQKRRIGVMVGALNG
jgi:hypothetical protein